MNMLMPCPNPACFDGKIMRPVGRDETVVEVCPRCKGKKLVEPKDDEELARVTNGEFND